MLGDVSRLHLNLEERSANIEKLPMCNTKGRRWAAGGGVGEKIVLFGGWDEQGPLNDVQLFDSKREQWASISMQGNGPSARRWTASAVLDGRLVVTGGYDGKAKPYADTWACDIVAGRWMQLPWNAPSRSRHTLCGGLIVGGFEEGDKVSKVHFEIADQGESYILRLQPNC